MSGTVIAIDGPAASGKSSTARSVAEALGFQHLDSGALYRGVTLAAIDLARERGLPDAEPLEVLDPETILRSAEDRGLMLQPDGHGFTAYYAGEPVDTSIRSPEVTARVSAVSAVAVIREWINARLRAMVRAGMDVVVDGRDIGTVVFPDADLKIFLTATPQARAARRLVQQGSRADPAAVAREAEHLAARDRADSTRAIAPLTRAGDAIELDTTELDFAEQVARIVALAHARGY
ncbi:MAG TPA: (d)CMP kinase [Gemmatimonadales bacterium]|nr:(d)CMP kinase [Gemmatimonadales bacterium]